MSFDLLSHAEEQFDTFFDRAFKKVDQDLKDLSEIPDELIEVISNDEKMAEEGAESAFLSADFGKGTTSWAYNYNYLAPLPFLDKVPLNHGFQFRWLLMSGARILQGLVNQIVVKKPELLPKAKKSYRSLEKAYQKLNHNEVKAGLLLLIAALPGVIEIVVDAAFIQTALRSALLKMGSDPESGRDALRIFNSQLLELLKSSVPEYQASKLEDYENLFQVIPLPEIAHSFQDDQVFADMRVAGANPMNLVKLSAPIAQFPLEPAVYKRVMGAEDSLEEAIASGRAFVVDYSVFAGAVLGTYPEFQKFIYPTVGLFVVPKSGENRRARAVGIRIETGGPVFSPPAEGDAEGLQLWKTAKNCFQVSDSNIHEAISHLGQTHLVVEPILIAAYNNLPADHPLMRLLAPHFVGTLAINNAAQAFLIAPKGAVDALLGSSIDQDRVVAVLGNQAVCKNFNQHFVPQALAARGVLGEGVDLPYFPYRDASLALWKMINEWCMDYVAIHYFNDLAVLNDAALQKMLAEMLSFEGGRMANVGENGSFKTRAYLADFLTMVIFTASAQHAAVNFPQFGIMSYAPAMPLAGYTSVTGASTNWENALPPISQALTQLNVLWLLGTIYYNQLGVYPKDQFKEPSAQEALQKFQERLKAFEAVYPTTFPDYPYLLPSKIPASINI